MMIEQEEEEEEEEEGEEEGAAVEEEDEAEVERAASAATLRRRHSDYLISYSLDTPFHSRIRIRTIRHRTVPCSALLQTTVLYSVPCRSSADTSTFPTHLLLAI